MAASILQLLFPSVCLACGCKCATKWFCPPCWLLCELPDPANHCQVCFQGLEEQARYCASCREGKKRLPMVRGFVFDPESPARLMGLDAVDALAGFAYLQWIQLEWPDPDVVIPMPDSAPIAAALASLMQAPLVKALSPSYEYYEDRLEEENTLLLFDVSHSSSSLHKAASALSASFPKKIFVLSLFPYADSVF
ncbi:MAG: phosphoribosyltransferase [Verrucomicrobia bacterium]|nr:phosphoribosyltransferase [Verrucomicrobiota bacterium]MBU6445915.1 phosphoribosyltransferase [Verrucomicrobiota bacterium]MDE3046977.1 phosphoribosyltransferase [Verrucomicrobiota bacterium]